MEPRHEVVRLLHHSLRASPRGSRPELRVGLRDRREALRHADQRLRQLASRRTATRTPPPSPSADERGRQRLPRRLGHRHHDRARSRELVHPLQREADRWRSAHHPGRERRHRRCPQHRQRHAQMDASCSTSRRQPPAPVPAASREWPPHRPARRPTAHRRRDTDDPRQQLRRQQVRPRPRRRSGHAEHLRLRRQRRRGPQRQQHGPHPVDRAGCGDSSTASTSRTMLEQRCYDTSDPNPAEAGSTATA